MEVAHDEAGRPYFYNERTGKTSWENPTRKWSEGSRKQFPSRLISDTQDTADTPYYYDHGLVQAKDGTGENAVGVGTDKATKKKILKKKEWQGRKIRRNSLSKMV